MILFPRRCVKAGCHQRTKNKEDGYWLCHAHAREYRAQVPMILRRDRS